jgi:hypothetical protein
LELSELQKAILRPGDIEMKKFKALVIALACGAALSVSAAAFTLGSPQNNNKSAACCDMKDCCKKDMSCCKKKRRGRNAHACCKGMDKKEACCCGKGTCPMPNKKKTT